LLGRLPSDADVGAAATRLREQDHGVEMIDKLFGKSLTTLLLALLVSAPVAAMPPELSGEVVKSIPGADAISGWSRLDDQRVLVNLDEKSTYLLTLKHQCHGLAWAQNVTVTMSNNTIWAGFDAIEADGRACPIHSIRKLDPKALLEPEG
jgi:hypothetical protein